MTDALHYLSIADAAERIRSRELSPVDLTRAVFARIDVVDAKLHSYITVLHDAAIDEARHAEQEIAHGRYRGPMHGIPVAIKDVCWTRGIRTTAHSRLLADWVPDEDATVVIRLREAGAIMLGKNAMLEFAYGTPGPDDAFPAARNPWNTSYAPGGSSSGSCAAVAAGLAMGSVGTDTGGSIRHPAAVCGCVGMKPTYGRVSQYGVIPVSLTLDHIGPLTRGARDSALMLAAIAGYDPKDPNSANALPADFLCFADRGIKGLRIGIPESLLAGVPCHPEVTAAFEEAKRVLRELGAVIKTIEVSGANGAQAASAPIMEYEAYQYHKNNISAHPDKYGAKLRARILLGKARTRKEYDAALRERERLRNAFAAAFESGIDVVVTPGRESPAVTMDEFMSTSFAARGACTRIFNFTGMPALVLPMGFTRDGLPLSLQFAARDFAENVIYQAAIAYEDATPWHKRHPPL